MDCSYNSDNWGKFGLLCRNGILQVCKNPPKNTNVLLTSENKQSLIQCIYQINSSRVDIKPLDPIPSTSGHPGSSSIPYDIFSDKADDGLNTPLKEDLNVGFDNGTELNQAEETIHNGSDGEVVFNEIMNKSGNSGRYSISSDGSDYQTGPNLFNESDDEGSSNDIMTNSSRCNRPSDEFDDETGATLEKGIVYEEYDGERESNERRLSADKVKTVQRKLFTDEVRVRPQKTICPYCKVAKSKLARHLTTVHKTETEVKELLKYPKGSNERNKIFEKLRKKNYFERNTQDEADTRTEPNLAEGIIHDETDDERDSNVNKMRSEDDAVKTVRRKLFTDEKVRYPPKKNVCPYCKVANTKLARHLTTVHKMEDEVKQLSKFPKASNERNKILEKLRKKGNFDHNTHNKDEEIYLVRKPYGNRDVNKENYKPCPSCKGYYSVKSLRQHYARCGRLEPGTRNLLVQSRALERAMHPKANNILQQIVLPTMREDDVCRAIRYDELAVLYGNRLSNKYKSHHHHDMIRAKLRLIGRLILAIKSNGTEITEFKNALCPQLFDEVVKAINTVARLDDLVGKYKSPATAFALGILLKDCTKLLITECVKKQDEKSQKTAQDFLKLLESELNASINKTVTENWSERQRQKQVQLPLIEDIRRLTLFLNKKRCYYLSKLQKEGYSWESWINLTKLTLVSVLIFNRRRPGELERSTIADFMSHVSINEHMNIELYNSLSEDAKEYAKQYIRFKIRGKKGRTVPVLLDSFMKICIENIIQYRSHTGIPERNLYIFGIPGSKKNNIPKYLRAYRLLNDYSVECGAQHPQTLKATELRKHVATTSVKMKLSEGEIDNLQEFMGHADKIHREHYRQPLIERDIVNMSKLLKFAQGDGSNSDKTVGAAETEDISTVQNVGVVEDAVIDTIEDAGIEQDVSAVQDVDGIQNDNMDHDGSSEESDSTNVNERQTSRHFRMAWSTPEKKIIQKCFKRNLKKRIVPSAEECNTVLQSHSILKHRSTNTVKAYVANLIKKESRSPKRPEAKRTYWTSPEKRTIQRIFRQHLKERRYPSMSEYRAAVKEKELSRRSPKKVRSYIQNLFRKMT